MNTGLQSIDLDKRTIVYDGFNMIVGCCPEDTILIVLLFALYILEMLHTFSMWWNTYLNTYVYGNGE